MSIYDFYPKIFEKKIPLNLLNIPSRNYIHWKKENLLNTYKEIKSHGVEKRERVLLNVFDALWLLIIKELREFNVDFQTIRSLKDIIYSNIQLDQEKIDSKANDEFINSILKYIPSEYQEKIMPFLIDGSFLKLIDNVIDKKNAILFKNIGGFLSDILIREISVSLIIKKNNGFLEVEILKIDSNNSYSNSGKSISDSILKDTFINVPIAPLIGKLFENSNFDKYTFQLDLFNQNEKKIIDALNDDLCKEIKVSKHLTGDITLSLTFEQEVKNENAKEVRRILGFKKYEKMELVYRNDKHIIINNTRKEILKKG
ncbi:hypothetical protein [Flavobacterium sp.]|uniref:hypothetical protein n=1 Tax=Flavobacterium sp. TaxID=239 RepID=UPI0024890614|nr:hypothetical protein [Flavobacterium sp.]MDI1316441.1 hypothetical protein [Flavobacterium sp.]